MCTLTLIREAERLLVTMNRDDIATREEAPPVLWPHAQPAFAAPKDLQAGGTWIGVNANGVIACLLNRYDEAPIGAKSRGGIVLEAMRGKTVEDACDALSSLGHSLYSPFTCIVADRGRSARIDWTGVSCERTDLTTESDVMLTSSSWQVDEVRAQREALFQTIWSNNEYKEANVAAFHSARDSAHDAWAPMMQRPSSQTKSITQVELTARGAEMRYWTRASAISRRLTAPDASVRLSACSPQLLEANV
jgi:uncharacterized protein with NRDE domain